jgi:hypothetical protein
MRCLQADHYCKSNAAEIEIANLEPIRVGEIDIPGWTSILQGKITNHFQDSVLHLRRRNQLEVWKCYVQIYRAAQGRG